MPTRPPVYRPPGAGRPRATKVTDPYYGSAAWKRLRAAALQRDGGPCTDPACSTPGRGAGGRLIVDHIVPRRDGGADVLDNLRTLCPDCDARRHRAKGLVDR